MTFNRPLPPVELFIRKLGWAVASSWTHSSASCREHQGLGDLALIVSLASLHWCLSHKGWELHFQKQLFDHYLSALSEERETSEPISVNIPFSSATSLDTSLLLSTFLRLKCTIPLWKTATWCVSVICASSALRTTSHRRHSDPSGQMGKTRMVEVSFIEPRQSLDLEG